MQGIIKVDDQPIKGVVVTFHPVDTTSIEKAFGETDENGNYKLTSTNGPPQGGALAGDYRVTVSWTETEKFVIRRDAWGESKMPTYEEKLPKIYQNPETSELTATVKKGKNRIDFGVKSKL